MSDQVKRMKLITPEGKECRLNPYKRITKGTTILIDVDGEQTEAIVDTAGKYTYLNVLGVDYYVTGALAEGEGYTAMEWIPSPPKPKAEPKVDAETGEIIPPKKRNRKPKAEAADE
jgi:hypothetical protein